MPDPAAPVYGQLLREAHELGRRDGAFAFAFETPDSPAPTGDRCQGRTPAEFARLLWKARPGTPPVGLQVNAPLWYATGFAEELEARADQHSRAAPGIPAPRLSPDRPESAPSPWPRLHP